MERAGEFLGKVARRLGRPEAALAWLESAWPVVVGPMLAAHTRPVRCDAHCLELTADARTWQTQLEHMQADLCSRINHAWGGTLVREIRFVPAKSGLRKVAREADNDHTPFIRRRRA